MAGASRGFSVLVLGEMLLRVAGPGGQQLGLPFAILGAAGFVLAGHRAAVSARHHLVVNGAAAAVAAFCLTIPLRIMLHDPVLVSGTAITVGFAGVIGAAAGTIVRSHRRRVGADVAVSPPAAVPARPKRAPGTAVPARPKRGPAAGRPGRRAP